MDIVPKGDLFENSGNLGVFIDQISGCALYMIDVSGRVTSWNTGAERLKGYSAQEIIGHHFSTFYTDTDIAAEKPQRVLEMASREGVYREECLRVRKDGIPFWAVVMITALRDKEGKLQGFASMTHDISEYKANALRLQEREATYRALYENCHDAIFMTRPMDGAILMVNQAACDLFGYSEQEFTSLHREQVIDVTDPRWDAAWALRAETGAGAADLTFFRKGGVRFEGRMTSRLFTDEHGQQLACTSVHDITERRQAEAATRQLEAKFRATFEHAPLGLAECTVDGTAVEVNSKLLDILGYTRDEALQLTVRDLTYSADLEKTLSDFNKLTTGKIDSYSMEKRYVRKDRSIVWVNVTASMAPLNGRPRFMIVAVEDITARKKAEEDLKMAIEASYHQANHDMLTGLANRASFNSHLKEALSYAKRDGHLVAIHLLDLDGFKSVNDTLGHHIGDLLLQEVARRIKSHVRVTDLAARLGGDEFVVIQTHLAEPDAAGVLAGKLVEDLERQYALEDQQVNCGASIGIVVYPTDADDPEELLKHADMALYDAKNRGRRNYQFYRKELGAAFLKAQKLERELTRALTGNEFRMYYQPQFDLKNLRLVGMEALVRWHHPYMGKLAASAFIHDAERAKLMPLLGEWTLRTACQQYRKWIDSGLAMPLTLNLSFIQLRDSHFMRILEQILGETKVHPSSLQLEMRESALWGNRFPKNLLGEMKEYGLHLAIDDFGTEMTALSTLEKFPVDAVKFGPRFVRELPSHKQGMTILSAIVSVAHPLEIAVHVDGIETSGQLDAVRDHGCDAALGFLLSPPLDTNEMEQRIEKELAH